MPEEERSIVVVDKREQLERVEPPPQDDSSPGALVRLAIERDLPIEKIEKLLELQERWERHEAKKAFVAAMSKFKEHDCPVIGKDKQVSFRNSKGKLTEYNHASLAHVVAQCVHGLAKHGFHHDWETSQERGITVTCVITHRLGHEKRKTLNAPPDTSGTKNQIQAIASTVTYLERYTLLQALGLAPAEDDDGRRAYSPEPQGREEPPPQAQRDPRPSKRALDAIKAFGKFLGQEEARADLERAIGKPAGVWEGADVDWLLKVWQAVRWEAQEDWTSDQRGDALRRHLFPEPQDNPPPEREPGQEG